jgi:DNA-binding CsgD family transcriptional regulator
MRLQYDSGIRARTRERRTVASAIAELTPVCVVGPAGIGKTTLVREVLRQQPHAEGLALTGLRWRPWAPLSIAVQTELSGDPESVASEVRRLLGPRTLFVDDLQYADASTLAALGVLAGRVPLVVTARTGEVELPWSMETATVELGPLPESVCRALARALHSGLSSDDLDRLVELAGGSPLLIEHLVLEGRTTPTLRAAAVARLSALTPELVDAVTELAVLGRPVDPAVLDVDASELPSALVDVTDGLAALRHQLLAEAALATLDEPALAATHRRLARRLPVAEAAEHHLLAGDLEQAGVAAQCALTTAIDPAERARLLVVAARATDDDQLRVAAAQALVAIGEWTAARAIASAVTSDDPELAAEAAYHDARSRWFASDIAGARAALEAGLAMVAGSGRPIEVRLLIEDAHQRVRLEESTHATTPIAERALAAAVEADVEVPKARLVLATALAHDGRAGWEPSFRQAIAAAETAGDRESECAATYFLASHIGLAGRPAEALALLEATIGRADDLGLGTWRTHMEAAALTDRFLSGADARQLAVDGARFVEAHPLFRNRAQADLIVALSLADDGRHDQAREMIETSLAERTTGDDRSILLTVATELAWMRGDLTVTIELADAALALGAGWFGITAGAAAAAALARLELGDTDVPEAPPRPTTPLFTGFVDVVEALRGWGDGRPDAGIAQLDAVADRWAEIGTVRYEVRARWAAAEIARQAGLASAERRMAAVAAVARRHGLAPLLRRAETAQTTGPRRPTLTPREAAVMALVADGCSSQAVAEQLGITRPTVESHVRAVMRKAGVTTRRQAVIALGESIHR